MATTSFFYGGGTPPEQNSVNELIVDLEAKVQTATAAQASASASATSASLSASSAANSASQAAALISHFTISTNDPSGGVEGDVWFKVTQ